MELTATFRLPNKHTAFHYLLESQDLWARAGTFVNRGGSPTNHGPFTSEIHEIVFFQRHESVDPNKSIPGRTALNSWPTSVRAKARAVLIAVASAPPNQFSGGGYWEAMRGSMSGWFEIRLSGPKRHHYRLFCLLDYEGIGQTMPLLVVIDGRDKPFRTKLSEREYRQIRNLGVEYFNQNPRSII